MSRTTMLKTRLSLMSLENRDVPSTARPTFMPAKELIALKSDAPEIEVRTVEQPTTRGPVGVDDKGHAIKLVSSDSATRYGVLTRVGATDVKINPIPPDNSSNPDDGKTELQTAARPALPVDEKGQPFKPVASDSLSRYGILSRVGATDVKINPIPPDDSTNTDGKDELLGVYVGS